jgi:3-oxo-5alpha-steroid 4-dehydrogenase
MSPARSLLARDVLSWDQTADVVVVGYGVAGACAAIGAAGRGANVLVLERAGAGGGAAALSDGMVYLGGGTATQRAAGVDDDPAEMRRFLLAACGPAPDEAKTALYVERSIEHHDWLVSAGVEFLGAVNPRRSGPSASDGEGLMYTGGENAAPFSDLARPAQRAHVTQGGRPGGAALMAALISTAEAAGVQAMFDTRAERLVTDESGTVVGVLARRYGTTVAVRARRGVVLSAGGFAFSDDMLTLHAPAALRTPHRVGTEGDDGHGIRMAQAVGARTKHMDALEWALPFNLSARNVGGILINHLGRRFVNEDTYMGRAGQAAMQEAAVYLVLDEAHMDNRRWPVPPTWAGETTAELEAEIGLPDGSLTSTLERYNAHAERGGDPDFGKRADRLSPLSPPLAVYDLGPHRFPNAVFTLGGLDTTTAGEVLDVDGSPIPGLFAAGRTTSGVAAHGYCSGLSLGDGSLFGRIAGETAAGRN